MGRSGRKVDHREAEDILFKLVSKNLSIVKVQFLADAKRTPFLFLGPTFSRYYNAIFGQIFQNPRFATLGAYNMFEK